MDKNTRSSEETGANWRLCILNSLQQKKQETDRFVELIASHINLQAELNRCKAAFNRLEYEKGELEKLFGDALKDDSHPQGKMDKKALDQRALQKELMDALRKKSEYADKFLEMTVVVKEKEAELAKKDKTIHELEVVVSTLKAESEKYQQKYEYELTISTNVKEEHRNLEAHCIKESEKNNVLRRTIESLNQELQELRGKKDKSKRLSLSRTPLQSSQDTTTEFSPEKVSTDIAKQHSSEATGPTAQDPYHSLKKSISPSLRKRMSFAVIPSTNVHQFDAHESDVSALCFSPDGTCLATGGSDKVVKVWTLKPDMLSVDPGCTVLMGSKASIVSLQFDPASKMVLAASNDNTARIWAVSDPVCKNSLVGHSAKVMAAKFLADDIQKVVTGSHDRTLKIWDISQNNVCLRTVFTGSSCNDVIALKGRSGCGLISGHLDKRIRFWDIRSTSTASEISLPGKITSLDHNPDRQLLLCCSQDDTLRLIDLRQNAITASFSAGGFKVAVDWSRACFSPDGQYVAAGSADGSVFVWEVATGRMKSKKEHTGSAVVVCGWHSAGQLFASGDRNKKVVLWRS